MPIGPGLPGLDKAEGRAPAEAAPETVDDLKVSLAQLKERTDAERVELTRQVEHWKSRFQTADAEVQKHQTAVAEMAAENDEEKRHAIKSRL